MGSKILWATIGASVALILNSTIAGIVNKVLSPLGITYA